LACGLCGSPAPAQEAKGDGDGKKSPELPLTDVVMFSSGVAYFERNAKVNGDSSLELKFKAKDINDLLKSMVVQDFGGGKISTVNYTSQDPITRTLKTFAIDLTTNPTLGDLLNQVRGERVAILAPNKIEGTILGVEKKTLHVKDKSYTAEYLNLLTDDGLRSVDLALAQQIQLVRPELEAELRQALALLAGVHESDTKTVALSFRGQGQREVRVGYIVESPIWKTSYRLVIDKAGDLLLQGWAIVENTTESDWKNVNLTLVSGRPISFRMDLYTPLYVNRPVVQHELYSSLRPQTYDQDMAHSNREFEQLARNGENQLRAAMPPAPQAPGAAFASGFGGYAADGREAAAKMDRSGMLQEFKKDAGVESLAQAGEVGELFRYVIENPVTIARRQSAMLPIANESIKGEKVSIYNEQVQTKHPLNGLRMKNTTGLHLMQGPITIYDGGVYAGDAKIQDLTPGTERLISYALDLDTEVATKTNGQPEEILTVKLGRGTLVVDRRARQSRTFTVKNSGSKTSKVLLEHPKQDGWNLVGTAEPEETTRDRYRFAVKAEPGKPQDLTVTEERRYSQAVVLTNLDDNTIRYYFSRPVSTQKVKDALTQVLKLRGELVALQKQRQLLQQELATIEAEQSRIRQNMPQLDRGGDLYGRYVKKLNEQEDRIEAVRGQVEQLVQSEQAKQRELDTFLLNIKEE